MLPAWRKNALRSSRDRQPMDRGARGDPPPVGLLSLHQEEARNPFDREEPVRGSGDPAELEIWQRCKEALDKAKASYRTLVPPQTSTNEVWLPSFVALGSADVASLARPMSELSRAVPLVGVGGGVGLILASTHDLTRARTIEQRLDAGNDLAWGAQGLSYLAPATPAVEKLALGLGVVGAATQTAVGALRIKKGLKLHDPSLVKLGALDVAGGLLWLTWDVIGWEQPIFIGSYVLLMIGREAYANKNAVRSVGRRIWLRAQGVATRARLSLDAAEQDLERLMVQIDLRAQEIQTESAR